MADLNIIKRTLALFDLDDIKYIKSKLYAEYIKKIGLNSDKPKEKRLGGQYDRFRKQ